MRLSLFSLNSARLGAAFVTVEARIKISLPSSTEGVDQRELSSWQADLLAGREDSGVARSVTGLVPMMPSPMKSDCRAFIIALFTTFV
jgi:hypothetical protein